MHIKFIKIHLKSNVINIFLKIISKFYFRTYAYSQSFVSSFQKGKAQSCLNRGQHRFNFDIQVTCLHIVSTRTLCVEHSQYRCYIRTVHNRRFSCYKEMLQSQPDQISWDLNFHTNMGYLKPLSQLIANKCDQNVLRSSVFKRWSQKWSQGIF